MNSGQVFIDATFRARMTGTFGVAGTDWLTQVEPILHACARKWNLAVGPAYPDPSYQLVFRVTGRFGERYALKLGVPRDELREEATALRLWGGRGAVRLIASDPDRGALLLERVEPGTQLAEVSAVDDDRATVIWSMVFRRLAEATDCATAAVDVSPTVMPSLARWGDAFDRYLHAHSDGGPLKRSTVLRARSIYRRLDESTTIPRVLHGDLHHDNILRAENCPERWLVIDPKGVAGDPAFEVGSFLRNPKVAFGPKVNGVAQTRRRIDIIAETTGLDRQRFIDWAWAGTVLSAVWCVEDEWPASASHAWPVQVAGWIAEATQRS
jgi:streptomycin 6-kinase